MIYFKFLWQLIRHKWKQEIKHSFPDTDFIDSFPSTLKSELDCPTTRPMLDKGTNDDK